MPSEPHVEDPGGKENTRYPRKLGIFQNGWSTKLVMSRVGRERMINDEISLEFEFKKKRNLL